jgi:hypothetical protein
MSKFLGNQWLRTALLEYVVQVFEVLDDVVNVRLFVVVKFWITVIIVMDLIRLMYLISSSRSNVFSSCELRN